jgi:hypothetical protein
MNQPIEALTLQIIDERLKICGDIEADTYGIFGPCVSQAKSCIDELTDEFVNDYDQEAPSHEVGQHSVDVVVSALQAIPGCSVEQTPHWSAADIEWKWDLILRFREYCFPIQVKSSLDGVEECQSLFENVVYTRLYELEKRLNKSYEARVKNLSRKLELSRGEREQQEINQQIEDLEEKRDGILEEAETEYELREPLYIWVSRDIECVLSLLHTFCALFKVKVTEEIKSSAVSHYKNLHKPLNLEDLIRAMDESRKTKKSRNSLGDL